MLHPPRLKWNTAPTTSSATARQSARKSASTTVMSAVFRELVGGRSASTRARQLLSRASRRRSTPGGTAAVPRAIDHRLDHRCGVEGHHHTEPALGERDLLRLVAELVGPDATSVDHAEPIPDRRQKTALGT